jgi:hypothetical protein
MRLAAPSTIAASTTWPAGALRLVEARHQAESEVERAPSVIAEKVERRRRGRVLAPDRVQGPHQTDVVEVVARGQAERTVLSPPRHAAIDQPRIETQAGIRAEPELLHDSRAEAFQHGVGLRDQIPRDPQSRLALQVEDDRTLVAMEQVLPPFAREAEFAGPGPLHQQDVGAHIGQQHAAERPRPDAAEFQDADAAQRTHSAHLASSPDAWMR